MPQFVAGILWWVVVPQFGTSKTVEDCGSCGKVAPQKSSPPLGSVVVHARQSFIREQRALMHHTVVHASRHLAHHNPSLVATKGHWDKRFDVGAVTMLECLDLVAPAHGQGLSPVVVDVAKELAGEGFLSTQNP